MQCMQGQIENISELEELQGRIGRLTRLQKLFVSDCISVKVYNHKV